MQMYAWQLLQQNMERATPECEPCGSVSHEGTRSGCFLILRNEMVHGVPDPDRMRGGKERERGTKAVARQNLQETLFFTLALYSCPSVVPIDQSFHQLAGGLNQYSCMLTGTNG